MALFMRGHETEVDPPQPYTPPYLISHDHSHRSTHASRHRLLEELEQLARVALKRVRLVAAAGASWRAHNLHLADVGGALEP
eukprot:5284002-Prymnesium_polylepis.1